MEIKWFFVVFGVLFTAILLSGQLFIGTYLSDQDRKHFQTSQNNTDVRFNESIRVHSFLFDNITDLKKALDPILDQIPNATQSRIDQQQHYEQDKVEFEVVKNVSELLQAYSNGSDRVDREAQHQKLLETMNQILSKFVNGSSTETNNDTIIPIPTPEPIPVPPIVDNITDVIVGNVTDGNITDDRGGDVPIPGPLGPSSDTAPVLPN